ncbi:MAG TPA: 2-oxoacid:acceptor oxidoreductase subunit alpha [Candidatus Acidoferrales bacterium]|nr:2-oxoacid:acceptor oxidoreductase subunit alpha [Candidatus Acidoferrales bacterium]
MDLTIRLAGESGEGVILAGEVLTYSASRMGLKIFNFRTYPSSVRGGPCMYQLRVSNRHAYSQGDALDLLVALDTDAISSHSKDLKPDGELIFDSDRTSKTYSSLHKHSSGVPFTSLAQNKVGYPKAKNMIVVGYTASTIGISKSIVEEVVKGTLSSRGEEVLQKNLSAINLGMGLAPQRVMPNLKITPNKIVVTGNQAIVLGAIAAGCRFYAGYPITPASDILEGMANYLPSFGGAVFQGEDEIASIGAAIGASYVGTKSMTATSGPGLSLMTEMIGMASMAEIPLVVVDAQRGGPSTGLPTKTEQSDLNHALYAGHGDAPRIVIAPGNVEDCFYQTIRAFNLSERYQLPVLLLTDQSLAQLTEGMPMPDVDGLTMVNRTKAELTTGRYLRYAITHDGISSMSIPGEPRGEYVAESVEHDEDGRPSIRPEVHSEMEAKRNRKLETAETELANDPLNAMEIRDSVARVGVIGWGSTQGAIHDAILRARKKSIRVRWLQCKLLNPLPKQQVSAFLKGLKSVLVPELNHTAQFAKLLKANFSIRPISFNKSEGLPFTPNEVLRKIEEVA